MKIALLNFPLDNNYGGNLQRYALMKVLADLGHEPVHLYTRGTWETPSLFVLAKRFLKCLLHGRLPYNINHEGKRLKDFNKQIETIEPFYHKYIKHTDMICSVDDFKKYQSFDAYIVGSDQVWRKSMSWFLPYETFFFDWLENIKAKRIAYSVSFGTDEEELSTDEALNIKCLYNKFSAVSVRESSALDILERYEWICPKAENTVDPTLLLDKTDYLELVNNAVTNKPDGEMLCYILDRTPEKETFINKTSQRRNLDPYYMGIEGTLNVSIEQWIRNFADAKYVVTDSYHGCLFSIIFNKPFKLLANERRGMARFESIFTLFGIDLDSDSFDWIRINNTMLAERKKALEYLNKSLKK